jgi:GNAT superfamily N-acetyltransferase
VNWALISKQFEPTDSPGLHHDQRSADGTANLVEVLRWYDDHSKLRGLLVYSPHGVLGALQPGQFFFIVHPRHRRQGIGTKLLGEARLRFPPLDFAEQEYSEAGLECLKSSL